MKDLALNIKRLLEYSGAKVETISDTADGVIVRVDQNGQKIKIFVCKELSEYEHLKIKTHSDSCYLEAM